MFDVFVRNVERFADDVDEFSYPGALLGAVLCMTGTPAIVLAGMAVTTQRRIKKFINKVLNKDEGE